MKILLRGRQGNYSVPKWNMCHERNSRIGIKKLKCNLLVSVAFISRIGVVIRGTHLILIKTQNEKFRMRIYESENVTLLCFALAHGDKSFGVLRPCARMDLRKEWADYELYICDLSCEHEMLVSWVKPLIFCMRHARKTFGQEIYMFGFRRTACRQALQVGKRKMLRRGTELRLEIVPQNLAPFLRAAASALGRKFIAFANCIHPLHMQNAICCCTDVFASAKSSKEFIFCWNRPHLKMISFLWAKRGQNPKPQNWKIEQTRASIRPFMHCAQIATKQTFINGQRGQLRTRCRFKMRSKSESHLNSNYFGRTTKCRNCSAQKANSPIWGQHRARRCCWWLLFSSSYFIRFCVGDIYVVAVVLFGSPGTARMKRPCERIGTTELDSFYLRNTSECVTCECVRVDSLPLGIASHAEQMLQFVLHKLEPAQTTNERTNERWKHRIKKQTKNNNNNRDEFAARCQTTNRTHAHTKMGRMKMTCSC